MQNLRRIIWLASFQKSGNTWLRNFLAHYMMPKGQAPDINSLYKFTTGDSRRDFFNAAVGGNYQARSIDDWLKIRPQVLRLIAGSKPDHHFVKTHCLAVNYMGCDLIPDEVTAAAIYIMRNPFDLVPSYARHHSGSIDGAIDRMCDAANVMGTEEGIFDVMGRWDTHVDSWTNAPGLPLHIIRYEDMLAKPGPTFSKLLDKFLRLKVDKPKLAYAIKQTSFESLKKQEEKHGFFEKPKEMQTFFAKGRSGVWREDLTPAQVARIREAFMPTLEKWYPEMLSETQKFSSNT